MPVRIDLGPEGSRPRSTSSGAATATYGRQLHHLCRCHGPAGSPQCLDQVRHCHVGGYPHHQAAHVEVDYRVGIDIEHDVLDDVGVGAGIGERDMEFHRRVSFLQCIGVLRDCMFPRQRDCRPDPGQAKARSGKGARDNSGSRFRFRRQVDLPRS